MTEIALTTDHLAFVPLIREELTMFAVKADNAFDGEQQLPGGAVVFIDEGKIVGVAAAPLAGGCAVTEFPEATMLPGLIDTHVHLGADGRDGALDRLADYRADELADVIDAAPARGLGAGMRPRRPQVAAPRGL